MDAMKSAGPKTSETSRLDEAAIASTAARPAASSIWASIPTVPAGKPAACSTWTSSTSSQTTAAGELTLGSTSESTTPGADPTTAITSW